MTMRPSSFIPFQQPSQAKPAKEAAEFLRAHDKMAALLPAVHRMAALQKDCAALLPSLFAHCAVLQFESGQLVFAVPNAALAARMKQQLPKLQDELLLRGWQVSAIRLKVQVSKITVKSTSSVKPPLSGRAISAFENLHDALEHTPRNQALRTALAAMMRHHEKNRR